MKHCVFCAAFDHPKNKKDIDAAMRAKESLEEIWDNNACITGHYEGSRFTSETDSAGNINLYLEDDSIHQLIYSCMAFAREKQRIEDCDPQMG